MADTLCPTCGGECAKTSRVLIRGERTATPTSGELNTWLSSYRTNADPERVAKMEALLREISDEIEQCVTFWPYQPTQEDARDWQARIIALVRDDP